MSKGFNDFNLNFNFFKSSYITVSLSQIEVGTAETTISLSQIEVGTAETTISLSQIEVGTAEATVWVYFCH